MPDRMMFFEDTYVVLSPRLEQQFVSYAELRQILASLLDQAGVEIPIDLRGLHREAQIDRLLATVCEFSTAEGVWQWYVVRLEK
ncbi:MAG: chlororespiratory reduction protein 7 [Pseudanabaenaceae cyanobacterium SKYGB_i_bin29]|nr:chlororespiratory reduction protein 7 [Pseudanabaenaceae cyanobacterium SKYG29]MDW8421202.1 chlororespiratory reduction protein 7 [Pseudanabaenaceae cyanobacterium SKYGB_i_bin29]